MQQFVTGGDCATFHIGSLFWILLCCSATWSAWMCLELNVLIVTVAGSTKLLSLVENTSSLGCELLCTMLKLYASTSCACVP